MINKICTFLIATAISTSSLAALNNPFDKTSRIDIGESVKWQIKNGAASKTSSSSDKDGTFYQLKITQSSISLLMLKSQTGAVEKFDQLTINDVQFDGKTIPLFKWCLNNQQSHNRFLQQGLQVNKGICQNKGQQGLFEIKLNQATYKQLKDTQNISFDIKPYRSAVMVDFEVKDMKTIFAKLSGKKKIIAKEKPVTKFLSKPIKTSPANKVVVPAVVKKVIAPCYIKAPASFSIIKSIKYNCNDEAAKGKARKAMAGKVKAARAGKIRAAKERELRSKQSKEKNKADAEALLREAQVINSIESNTMKIQNEVTEKMLGMCKKKWASGEHRCYCQPYIEFAPPTIKSDTSCAGS